MEEDEPGEDGQVVEAAQTAEEQPPVGAPARAAVRLLGPEARTLHNVNPSMGLDRKQPRSQKGKNDSLEESTAQACAIDELSMTAPEVYHAVGYRFALQRQEILGLDLEQCSFSHII